MTENPGQAAQATPPVNPATESSVPTENTGTGNPADAAPVQGNPTDSSSVSDSEGVQSEQAAEPQPTNSDGSVIPTPDADEQTSSEVDHEGTGAGTEDAPEGNYTDESDGSDNA